MYEFKQLFHWKMCLHDKSMKDSVLLFNFSKEVTKSFEVAE